MALPLAAPERQLKHRRSIEVEVFRRDDGLWEVDAHLCDVKTRDTPLASGIRRAGDPIHDMLLRLVVDERYNVVEAGAETRWMPYPGQCEFHGTPEEHGDAYTRLTGLNLARGFRRDVRERLAGVLGCTHITELTQVLPTAVIQAFAGEVVNVRGDADKQPFQLGRCHALRVDGPTVQEHYPRWYRQAAVSPADDTAPPAAQQAPRPFQAPSESESS